MELTEEIILGNLNNTLRETNFSGLGNKYQGKVRDNYSREGQRVIITSDRISAFDVVLDALPFKGQILNQLAVYWLEQSKHIVQNHLLANPDPNVMVVKECTPYKVEMVVRAYLAGSMWRAYQEGERNIYDLNLPEGMKENQKFPEPIVTPSSKADAGHDLPLTEKEIVNVLVPEEEWKYIKEKAIALFNFGTEVAAKQGLILVDTKYEFGKDQGGNIILVDEIHTPDSSRYWFASEYQDRFSRGEKQRQMDKEYVRQWLIGQGYMGDGEPPVMTPEVKATAVLRYKEVYEIITGKKFEVTEEPVQQRVQENLVRAGLVK